MRKRQMLVFKIVEAVVTRFGACVACVTAEGIAMNHETNPLVNEHRPWQIGVGRLSETTQNGLCYDFSRFELLIYQRYKSH